MSYTIEQLKEQAETIRKETAAGENTAERVGASLGNIIDKMSEWSDTVESVESVSEQANQGVKAAAKAQTSADAASTAAAKAQDTANSGVSVGSQALATATEAKQIAEEAANNILDQQSDIDSVQAGVTQNRDELYDLENRVTTEVETLELKIASEAEERQTELASEVERLETEHTADVTRLEDSINYNAHENTEQHDAIEQTIQANADTAAAATAESNARIAAVEDSLEYNECDDRITAVFADMPSKADVKNLSGGDLIFVSSAKAYEPNVLFTVELDSDEVPYVDTGSMKDVVKGKIYCVVGTYCRWSGNGWVEDTATRIEANRNGVSQSNVRSSRLDSRITTLELERTETFASVEAFPTKGSSAKIYIDGEKSVPYIWDGKQYVAIGGAAVGNCYNVTNEIPLTGVGEMYNLESAIKAAWDKGVAAVGVQITFAIAKASWKTYQYIGSNTTEASFCNTANWIDLAGMSAGSEAVINVNEMCADTLYNLALAINAIINLETETGITYRKGGLVITYKVADNVWETKQFHGSLADCTPTNTELWSDFGGGGSKVETSDTPEEDGTDALSTGGAYALQQGIISDWEQTEDADNILIQGVNARNNPVGSQIKIPKSSGGGTSSGSTLTIYLQEQALYAAYGSTISTMIAVKSVQYDGDTEILGMIRTLSIVDGTTGLTLWSEDVNQNSSKSATDFKFSLDFTDYITSATRKDFTIVATDADGNTKRRTLTVTAVDVTCTCKGVQTLHYTSGTSVTVGGSAKNILLYKFANNVSKSGIRVTVKMLYNGAWQDLSSTVVTDSYSHSVAVDPCNLFGKSEKMSHGAYPVMIQGEDIDSGVTGNTIYTSIMCIDADSSEPVVCLRYDDNNNGDIRLYDSLEFEVAAYTPGQTQTSVQVYFDGSLLTEVVCQMSTTTSISKQLQGYQTDGSKTLVLYATAGDAMTAPITLRVVGSAISATLKEGALFAYDFSTRSNTESDHTISNNGVTMTVTGANWSSNGFVNGEDRIGIDETCLRIAENVQAVIPYAPFGDSATERTNGMAFQMAFATANIQDDTAKLVECYDEESGAGFYITGNKVALFCKTGTPQLCTRSFKCGEKVTVAVVVEPSTITVSRGGASYATVKMYLNGEEVAAIGYVANSGAILNRKNITFDGRHGDLYLYYVLAYSSYYQWAQAFQNYLCKLTDTSAMVTEYEAENVLDSQNKPSLELLKAKEIPYYVVVASQETFDTFDGDIDTSKNFLCTLYYYHPTMPWRSFKAENVRWRRQGTTSAKRPIKNDRFYLQKEKNWKITALYPDYTNEDAEKTYALFELGYVRVGENTIPVKIITVKVDYSDSSNSNDCGVCDMMNATFRALGSDYMTPAQRAFDGSWSKGDVKITGLEMNHSTANHPVAVFRSTLESLADAWFHAKGNWKEDKGEQVALGFQNTPGYNLGCLNYGDFVEFFANQGETLDEAETRFKKQDGLDTSKVYLISLYCGRNYRFMRYTNGAWKTSTGTMKQVSGKWVITGDVLNPVSGFELLTYDALDWWQGVGSVEEMMAPASAESSWVTKLNLGQASYPKWTQYFECMIDNDQLQIDLAMGRKVPYELFNVLRFCDSCDYAKGGDWQTIWKSSAYKYMSVHSLMAYYGFTDYLAAVDQQAKNMQPMFFLEDGCSVVNGVYTGVGDMEPLRMYLNKVYDCDTCNGKDNDGGNTIDPEVDPADTTNTSYAGRGSVLWNDLRGQQEMVSDTSGNTLTLSGVIATMRSLPEIEGIGAGPFSPQGALYYFVTQRMKKWPKVISSYDGERKYINYTGYNDIYYYALQGLGLTSLPRFIEQRWRIRDGYYQTGDFKDASHILGGRVGAKTGAVIRFKAAKSGYFGIGNDGGNVTQGMYLNAGEEGVFSQFQHGDNILLYIYQADMMSEIDLSEISLDPQFSFSVMSLAERIVIGGESHGDWRQSPGNTGFLTTINFGDLPFLRYVDVRNTEIESINADKCPRLEQVLATGSNLAQCTLAETAPIYQLQLPGTLSNLQLIGLPSLAYPATTDEGLQVESFANLSKLWVETSPEIDAIALLTDTLAASSKLSQLRIADMTLKGTGSELTEVVSRGISGMDENGGLLDKPVVDGTYNLTRIMDDATMAEIEASIQGLTLFTALDAYIYVISTVNAESFDGEEAVDAPTLETIGDEFKRYNGEDYDEYIAGYIEDNKDINELIQQ